MRLGYFWYEEDGNPPVLGTGQTQFDSEVSDPKSDILVCMEQKICGKCKLPIDVDKFRKSSKSKDGLQAWCTPCFAVYEKERWHNGDSARKYKNKRNTKDRNKKKLWDYLSQHPCVDCGETDPEVLEFDHRLPEEKLANVVELFSYSWNKIMSEVEKCDVRCANCHRRRTNRQFGLWRANPNPACKQQEEV